MSAHDDERGLSPVEAVPVGLLRPSDSPRRAGEDDEHVRTLALSADRLPPIIVHRPTMRVIDGMHRLKAARLRGRDRIDARYFEGSEPDAFVLAVSANIGHGLPLSVADRTAAAVRILRSHPLWADRAIATATGLSAKTVAGLRRGALGPGASLGAGAGTSARIGRDGRIRPLDCTDARRRAAQFVADRPEASLREIARAVGLSPGTVRDVRERLRRGEEPVPSGRREAADAPTPRKRQEPSHGLRPTTTLSRPTLDVLRRDPSLRLTESGRHLLRLLDTHAIPAQRRQQIIDAAPAHCAGMVADVARECAAAWAELARLLERKHADGPAIGFPATRSTDRPIGPASVARVGRSAARRVAADGSAVNRGTVAAEPRPVEVTIDHGQSTRTALLLSPMLAEWDAGEHFRAVTEPLAAADYRVTFLDTLSLLGRGDDLDRLIRRWADYLGAREEIDLLGGNGLGGTVAQYLLAEPWARRTRALFFCAPTLPDAVLLQRVGGIARLAAEHRLEAAYQYAAKLMVPGGADGSAPETEPTRNDDDDSGAVASPSVADEDEHAPQVLSPAEAHAADRMVRGISLLTGADARAPLAAFPGPVLHVVGERSQIVREQHLGTGPNQRRLVVPGAGMRPYSERPDLVLAAMRELFGAKTVS